MTDIFIITKTLIKAGDNYLKEIKSQGQKR